MYVYIYTHTRIICACVCVFKEPQDTIWVKLGHPTFHEKSKPTPGLLAHPQIKNPYRNRPKMLGDKQQPRRFPATECPLFNNPPIPKCDTEKRHQQCVIKKNIFIIIIILILILIILSIIPSQTPKKIPSCHSLSVLRMFFITALHLLHTADATSHHA